jgi:uncharacterized protein (TIGR00251 family)
MSADSILAVRVSARASRDAIEGVDESGSLRVRVTAAPVDGAANVVVTRLVAGALGLSRGAVSVASGATSRHKRLRIEGRSPDEIARRWPGASVSRG